MPRLRGTGPRGWGWDEWGPKEKTKSPDYSRSYYSSYGRSLASWRKFRRRSTPQTPTPIRAPSGALRGVSPTHTHPDTLVGSTLTRQDPFRPSSGLRSYV